jgi:hypothetical protein
MRAQDYNITALSGKKTGFRTRGLLGSRVIRGSARKRDNRRLEWAITQVQRASPTHDFELYVHVTARGVGIGADLFVCFLGEGRQFTLRQALVFDV